MFGCIMNATMIDKRMSDKSIQFEVSLGNAGNSLDGQIPSAGAQPGAAGGAPGPSGGAKPSDETDSSAGTHTEEISGKKHDQRHSSGILTAFLYMSPGKLLLNLEGINEQSPSRPP